MKKLFTLIFGLQMLAAQNQTETLSPVLPETTLPFSVEIELAPFTLPTGLQAYASAIYKGRWILLAGRTNGLHGFDNIGNNFPPQFQNTHVYLVDPETGASWNRPLSDSDLSQVEIDLLSTTASQSFQEKNTLYFVGGYGINTATGGMETKDVLTAIDLKKWVKWIRGGSISLKKAIKQISHPLLQVTGGFLFHNNPHDPFLLALGQNFQGFYHDDSNGAYTQEIRSFWLSGNGDNLFISPNDSTAPKPDYRRRDLNVVPIMSHNKPAYVAFGGVFTLDSGVWTVPIFISPDGSSFEPDPSSPNTFKQAMNHYNCSTFGLYSTKSKEMFVVFPGGISYGFFSNGVFETDSEIPFINQVTTIKIDKNGNYTQHLMNGEYPFIASTGTNPGNQLLFGAEAAFFPRKEIHLFQNGVIQLDKIEKPTIIGYIAGGIMSTLPNTNDRSDSTSSPYVFTVRLIPKEN